MPGCIDPLAINPGAGVSTNGRFFLQFAKVDRKLDILASSALGINAPLAVAAMAVSTASVRSFWL